MMFRDKSDIEDILILQKNNANVVLCMIRRYGFFFHFNVYVIRSFYLE